MNKGADVDTDPALEWYRDKPEVGPDGHWYIVAFWDLHTHRASWDPLSPIPRGAIRDYGIEHGLEDDVLVAFTHVIRQLDVEWLEDARVQMEEARAKANPPNPVTPPRGGGRMRR